MNTTLVSDGDELLKQWEAGRTTPPHVRLKGLGEKEERDGIWWEMLWCVCVCLGGVGSALR